MKRLTLRWAFALLVASGLALQGRADTLINNFLAPNDYVLNGIIGETNWDGVYLGFGDIPGGAIGGSGQGATLQGNSTFAPGFLTLQTIGTDWGGNGDDGFYAWKLVSGDFDVSVQSVPPWVNQGNNFAGLLIRAWNTNQSGARISFTSTNSSENYLQLWRDQQFAGAGSAGSQIRQTTNGTDIQYNLAGPGDSTDTNTARFFRITRTGDAFSFYWKTNQGDAWTLITNAASGAGYVPATGSISRPDWAGQPVQVGIAAAIFARPGTPAVNFFTDFELSGPNVKLPASMPAAPDTLVTSSPNTNGSLTFSWNTNGGTGSMLIIRKIANSAGVLVVNPVQGLTYNADTNFLSTNTFIAGNTRVVYAGSSNSVTVSGLGGSNNLYAAEVLSYDNTGSIIYNTATPATLKFLGPGTPSSIVVSINPTNIPLGGVGAANVVATFSTGEQVDVSSDPSVGLSSGDPTTIAVVGSSLQGLKLGSAVITATYAGFSGQVLVAVSPFRFTDNFSVSQDYLNAGLPGSTWDGIYDRPGDVSGAGNAGGGPVSTTGADANITAPNTLTVSSGGGDWAGASHDGFLMFKNITGDFQAMVHITSIPRVVSTNANNGDGSVGFMFAGLMARSTITNSENWVYWSEFDQFTDSTEARFALNGGDNERPIQDGQTKTNYWLLMQRVNGTNFYFYRKVNLTDPWEPRPDVTIVQTSLTNSVPMQVGLFQATYTPTVGTVQFDSFALDANGLVASPPMAAPAAATNFSVTLNPDITMTLQWDVPGTNADGSAYRSMVVMRANAPVSAQPFLNLGLGGDVQNPANPFGLATDNLGSGNFIVYRTPSGATNLHQQVIVTGLSPGVQYYATVYTFILGTSRVFNTAGPITANSPAATLIDGILTGLQSSLPANGIPLGGVGIPVVNGVFTGGGLANITPAVTITSDDTNTIVTTNNALTGLKLGTATIHVSYSGFTNVVSVTIRNPSFTDNFGVSHDYLANGTAGTPWDGIYTSLNVPDKTFVSDPLTATLTADANVTSNNVLSIANINSGYEFNQDDGTFLFKYVPGDFQAAVDLLVYTNNGSQSFNCSGLMARGYTIATNGVLGAPLDQAGSESWVAWERFDQFGNGTRYEATVANATQRPGNTDVNGLDRYMLLARVNGTNFYFFQRASTNAPWHSTPIGHLTGPTALARFAGQPMQVGIMVSGFNSGTPVNAGFANFVLDLGSPFLNIAPSGTNVLVSWPGAPSSQLQFTPTLNPQNWQPVLGTPGFTNGQFNLTLPASGNGFFRLQN